jgi:hypothetical protein
MKMWEKLNGEMRTDFTVDFKLHSTKLKILLFIDLLKKFFLEAKTFQLCGIKF